MIRVAKNFLTSGGAVSYVFDFFPEEPTMKQLIACLPHTCDTCRWKNLRHTSYCGAPDHPEGKVCRFWLLHVGAMGRAEHEYYKRLHEERYGNTGVSLR